MICREHLNELETRAACPVCLLNYWKASYENKLAECTRLRRAATRLCGASARVMLAAPSHGPLWHGSPEIKELGEVLLSDELRKLMKPLQEAES